MLESALPHSYMDHAGRWLLGAARTTREILAFALITLGVMVTRFYTATTVVRPLITAQIARSGLGLLPILGFLAVAKGFVVIGQMVVLFSHVGAEKYVGTVMVTAVVRELGPLVTALVVLVRIGTATVIELGTARALGEVEALEALGIDPIHYLVVPRVVGLSVATAALTVYFILGTLFSGCLFAFLQDVPLTPSEYFSQIALALSWQDFVLLGLKSLCFGGIVAIVTSFQGLARPLELAGVSRATTNAVVACTLACVALDAVFIVIYLLM